MRKVQCRSSFSCQTYRQEKITIYLIENKMSVFRACRRTSGTKPGCDGWGAGPAAAPQSRQGRYGQRAALFHPQGICRKRTAPACSGQIAYKLLHISKNKCSRQCRHKANFLSHRRDEPFMQGCTLMVLCRNKRRISTQKTGKPPVATLARPTASYR